MQGDAGEAGRRGIPGDQGFPGFWIYKPFSGSWLNDFCRLGLMGEIIENENGAGVGPKGIQGRQGGQGYQGLLDSILWIIVE